MKKKRILSVGCTLAVLATLATSCSTKDNSSDDGKKLDKELVYWTVGGATGDNKAGFDAVNDYLKEKLGFTVKVNIADWGDYDNKMNTILNSGEKFDLMFINNTNYMKGVNLGSFADITDSIGKDAPKLNDAIPQQVWDGVKIDGKIYAVPTYKDSSMSQYWFFDKQYVDKYNLDVNNITTFEDLDKAFRTMKEGEGESFYPLQMSQPVLLYGSYADYDGLSAGLRPLGVRIDDKSGKVVNIFEQPDIIKQFEYMHQWYKDGIINPDSTTMTETPKMRPFQAAQAFPGAEQSIASSEGVKEYVSVKVHGPIYSTESIQGSMNAVHKNSDNKKEALQYLELANTDHKLRDMMAYGAEGKDFEYVSDNVVKKLNDNYTWPSYTQATFFNMSTVEGAPEDQWKQVEKMNNEATSSVTLGFALDVTPINNEITACRTIFDKYKHELEKGARDPKEIIPIMNKELKQAGFDKVMEEAQKQIDEFLSK